jgi:DNA-binding response OmpR family regulator
MRIMSSMGMLTPALPRSKSTVLVVDDDEAVRQYMARVLEHEGYRVLLAADADEALVMLKRYLPRIHLVVTDVLLPRMTGPELALWVALQSPPPPVLFVSGGHNLGELPGPILWKPFLPTELTAAVSSLIYHTSPSGTAVH